MFCHNSFIGFNNELEDADVVFIGLPFDGTSSFRPGSRFGPDQIRQDSIAIETYSPYQNKNIEDHKICDVGNLEFPFGNTAKVMDIIGNEV